MTSQARLRARLQLQSSTEARAVLQVTSEPEAREILKDAQARLVVTLRREVMPRGPDGRRKKSRLEGGSAITQCVACTGIRHSLPSNVSNISQKPNLVSEVKAAAILKRF